MLNQTETLMGRGLRVRLYKINLLQRSECLGHRRMQGQMQGEVTGYQKRSLGCPVQGSCRTGCNTGSTGFGSGSTAATAERTGGRNRAGTEVKRCSQKSFASLGLDVGNRALADIHLLILLVVALLLLLLLWRLLRLLLWLLLVVVVRLCSGWCLAVALAVSWILAVVAVVVLVVAALVVSLTVTLAVALETERKQ